MHSPGPAASAELPLQQPLFLEHAKFLDRMLEQGLLIAAGPLLDAEAPA